MVDDTRLLARASHQVIDGGLEVKSLIWCHLGPWLIIIIEFGLVIWWRIGKLTESVEILTGQLEGRAIQLKI